MMRRIICLVLSLVFVCTGMTVSAADDKFISEYIEGGNYETLYAKYSDFSQDANLLGFYKANTDCDAERTAHIAFYNDGSAYATVSGTKQILNFKGTYTSENGIVSVKLENNNEYVAVDNLIAEPFKYQVISGNALKYAGRDFSVSPKNGETYSLISGTGFDVITVKYNGEEVEFDQAPVIINGRTMVPIRAVMEKMGCTVTWKDATKTANIKNDKAACALQVGNELMSVLNKKTEKQSVETLDTAPVIINSRLLLPLRAVAEVFGAKVDWDETTRTVLVSYNALEDGPADTDKPADTDNPEGTDTAADADKPEETPTEPETPANPDENETDTDSENTGDEESDEPTTIYLKQRDKDSCTLASVAMMLRKKANLSGKDYVKITESSLKPFAWSPEGLKSTFQYKTYEISAYVHDGDDFASLLYEDKKDALIALLKDHPEGVVAYDYETPHAIWISSYAEETGYFYVADPSDEAEEGILILEESTINGEGVSGKITAIDKLWYVSK